MSGGQRPSDAPDGDSLTLVVDHGPHEWHPSWSQRVGNTAHQAFRCSRCRAVRVETVITEYVCVGGEQT